MPEILSLSIRRCIGSFAAKYGIISNLNTVFTNGCFDILHAGHIGLLEHCRKIGDKVIVGLNSDESVSRLKGPSRPINSINDRKRVLESIKYVDEVIVFQEDTPEKIIEKLKPNIIVKGGDYKKEDVVGFKTSQVIIFPFIEGLSTTKTISNIESNNLIQTSNSFDSSDDIPIHIKGWGREEWICNGPLYCGKKLVFSKGKRCSYHYHKLKDETFFVQEGEVIVNHSFSDDISRANSIKLKKGDRFHVPIGLRHQIVAVKDSTVIEFSTQHFESDSYRVIKGD